MEFEALHGETTLPSSDSVTTVLPCTGSLPSSTTWILVRDKKISTVEDTIVEPEDLLHRNGPESEETPLIENTEMEDLGGEDIDLLADPALWCPFPPSSQILRKEGKTIGFRSRSGIMFGLEKIEIKPDASGQ